MLYSNEPDNDVDRVLVNVFYQKTRDVERISPSDALSLDFKRSVFQASIWKTAHMSFDASQQPVWPQIWKSTTFVFLYL